jgi:predicted RNA-binding Zn-ribbon protein involved in translation (DUF1610 family)
VQARFSASTRRPSGNRRVVLIVLSTPSTVLLTAWIAAPSHGLWVYCARTDTLFDLDSNAVSIECGFGGWSSTLRVYELEGRMRIELPKIKNLGTSSCTAVIPLWVLAFLGLIPPLWWSRFAHVRRRKGACTHCGYNLTGNTTGACPECGKTVEAGRARAVPEQTQYVNRPQE